MRVTKQEQEETNFLFNLRQWQRLVRILTQSSMSSCPRWQGCGVPGILSELCWLLRVRWPIPCPDDHDAGPINSFLESLCQLKSYNLNLMRTTKSLLKLPPTKRERPVSPFISVRRGLGYFDEFPVLSMATSAFLESFYKHDIRKCDQDEHKELSRCNSLPCPL